MKIEWDDNRDVCIKFSAKELKTAVKSQQSFDKFTIDIRNLCIIFHRESITFNKDYKEVK